MCLGSESDAPSGKSIQTLYGYCTLTLILLGYFTQQCAEYAVITRLASKSLNLTGSYCLGIEDVSDPTSPYYGRKPIPPLLDAKMDLIFRVIMQPLKKKLLSELKAKMLSNWDRSQYWYEIFIAVVMILNNLEYLYNRQMEQVHRYCEQVRAQPSLDVIPRAYTDYVDKSGQIISSRVQRL